MDVLAALDQLAGEGDGHGRLVHVERLPPRPARFGDPAGGVSDEVWERLATRGVARLWRHQAEAIEHLRGGRHVALATGTASGKSLCYQVPIAESALEGRRESALLLFPTKALAHDQLRSLRSWLVPGLRAVAYDGDTPADERAWARRHATAVLTNPEMLHVGILPHHDRWATFLMRLRYVVVDELHTLRGVFGSHVAHLLRRLRRVCAHYGSDPVFCFASATIGNPAELASTLCGLPVAPVDDDASPRGERLVAVWDRPLVDAERGLRTSPHAATGALLGRLVAGGLRTIAFSGSRKGAELVARHARRRLEAEEPALAGTVAAYRGGFLPEERRRLEHALSGGELRGVAATNALELGIDVAGLDAVVLNGFPGTLASFWQQAGRAGRGLQPSAAVLVGGDDQLDRWYVDHPRALLTRPPEPAVVNPTNPYVARPHAGCAAFELPLAPGDADLLGDDLDESVRELVHAEVLKPRAGRMYWAGSRPPAPAVGLRTGAGAEFELLEAGSARLVGTVDDARVFHVAHPGALYLHQGRQYRVEHLDVAARSAWLAPVDVDEVTQPRHDVDVAVTGEDASRPVGRCRLHLGSVEVSTTTTAFQRRRLSSGEVLGTVPLDLPPRALATRACWYTVSADVVAPAGLDAGRLLGAVHAAEHALIGMLPLFAICDRWDVGGVSMAVHPGTGEATIFVYDGYPGGAGIAELAFAAAERHLRAAADVIDGCACERGCPSCVQSPKCGNWNEFLDKEAARSLLRAVLS